VPELAGEDEVREALEKAFDYRGDITVSARTARRYRLFIRPAHGRDAGRVICADYSD